MISKVSQFDCREQEIWVDACTFSPAPLMPRQRTMSNGWATLSTCLTMRTQAWRYTIFASKASALSSRWACKRLWHITYVEINDTSVGVCRELTTEPMESRRRLTLRNLVSSRQEAKACSNAACDEEKLMLTFHSLATAYLDGSFGFGQSAVELMPGYDCPTYAT